MSARPRSLLAALCLSLQAGALGLAPACAADKRADTAGASGAAADGAAADASGGEGGDSQGDGAEGGGGDGAADGADGATDGGEGADGAADGGTDGGGDGASLLDDEGALSALEIATAGLWYTSESDYPLDVIILADPGVELSAENATTVLAPAYSYREGTLPLAERAADEVTLGAVLDRYTVEQDWWDDTMRADAARWRALRAVFDEHLGTPRAFRLGERGSSGDIFRDVDIFVIGRTSSGAWAGFRTVSIET
jgi:hypothetical protein